MPVLIINPDVLPRLLSDLKDARGDYTQARSHRSPKIRIFPDGYDLSRVKRGDGITGKVQVWIRQKDWDALEKQATHNLVALRENYEDHRK